MSTTEPTSEVREEIERRQNLWAVLGQRGGPIGVEPSLLRELRIYRGGQGVWVDKTVTRSTVPSGSGVAVALLHTGRSYADDLSDDALLYHYPRTSRPGNRDTSEVEAIKAAGLNRIPLFVVLHSDTQQSRRDVRLGWVEDWDDSTAAFITFRTAPPTDAPIEWPAEIDFVLATSDSRTTRQVVTRPNQVRFKFDVLKRYGRQCAVCDVSIIEALEAAHIRGKAANGSDDPRNGILLCANHHRTLDSGLFAIDPSSLEIVLATNVDRSSDLQITKKNIKHLIKKPHPAALAWRWKIFRKAMGAAS